MDKDLSNLVRSIDYLANAIKDFNKLIEKQNQITRENMDVLKELKRNILSLASAVGGDGRSAII